MYFHKSFGITSIVISEGKEIVFFTKFLRVNRANKIYIDKLIRLLYSFL